MALVVGVAELFEAREQVVAQVKFDVARDADNNPAGEELEDPLGDGDGEQQSSVDQELVAGDPFVKIVRGLANHQRKQDPNPVRQKTQAVPTA